MGKNEFDDLPEGAMTLEEAFDQHIPPELHDEYRATVEARDEAQRKIPKRPSFFDGAYTFEWRMKQHEAHVAMLAPLPNPQEVYTRMLDVIYGRLLDGELVALVPESVGIGPWRPLPAALWQNALIKFRKNGVIMVDGTEYRGVRVFVAGDLNPTPNPGKTTEAKPKGGRPSAIPEILEDNRRRAENGEEHKPLKQEAAALLARYGEHNPDLPQPAFVTVLDRISRVRSKRRKDAKGQ